MHVRTSSQKTELLNESNNIKQLQHCLTERTDALHCSESLWPQL